MEQNYYKNEEGKKAKMKKVKTITIVLAIILVTLVAFVGVYVQTQNRMENKIKDYKFSREIEGGRVIEIKVSDGDEEDSAKPNPEDLTIENYEKVKNTIEKRLKNLGAQDYTISLNKENGTIIVELAEDDNVDIFAYYLTASRKVQIKEKETETELLRDNMVKKATYSYNSNVQGAYQVYLQLELTQEGQAKIEEILNDYALIATEVDEIEAANKEDEENAETEEAPEAEIQETENNKETKKIAVLSIAGTEYDVDKIEKNKITLKIGSQTSNTTSVNNYISAAAEITMLINSGEYPIEYEIENNRYVYSDMSEKQLTYFALIILAIVLVILVVYCIKYKISGLLASISFIGFIALYSLLLRYANVIISIEGIGAIMLILAINLKLNQSVLSKTKKINMTNEAFIATYKEIFLKLIPIIIISIVFCFAGWTNLSSFGMIMFWGLILLAMYNATVTLALLKLRDNK